MLWCWCCRAVLLPNARFKSFLLLTASVFCSCCYCYYSHVCSVSSLVDGTVISVHFRWGYKHTHTRTRTVFILNDKERDSQHRFYFNQLTFGTRSLASLFSRIFIFRLVVPFASFHLFFISIFALVAMFYCNCVCNSYACVYLSYHHRVSPSAIAQNEEQARPSWVYYM